MALSQSSLAAATGSAVKNVTFQPSAVNIPHKIVIIGTFDDTTFTGVTPEVPVLVTSPEDVGAKFGFGFMVHRLATRVYESSGGVETWIQPQDQPAGTQATGTATFTATSAGAGTVFMYIAGLAVPFVVAAGDDQTDVADAAVAAVTANKLLPVTATNALGVVTFLAKDDGPWGDDISIAFNLSPGDEFPTDVAVVVAAMGSVIAGAGIPTIQDALDGLGTGDDANENSFTEMVYGYGADTTTLDSIANYVGQGNDFIGLYDKLVARPFRTLVGDTANGSAGLTAMIAITDVRKNDRATGFISVPASESHPQEIAAQALGFMARINNDRAAQSYVGIPMISIQPGFIGGRWSSDFDSRDTAVKSGISPTRVVNGTVTLQNVVTFYRPDNVPVQSNGYRSQRNISILQNILANVRATFQAEKWQGISIVSDIKDVTNIVDRVKARDTQAVRDDAVALVSSFSSKAWIYDKGFSIDKLGEDGAIQVRDLNNGFDLTISVILSGEGVILDAVTEFDTSIAILAS